MEALQVFKHLSLSVCHHLALQQILLLMTVQMVTSTASMEGRLVVLLDLAHALLATKVLVAPTVQHAQKAILGMLLGVSLIV